MGRDPMGEMGDPLHDRQRLEGPLNADDQVEDGSHEDETRPRVLGEPSDPALCGHPKVDQYGSHRDGHGNAVHNRDQL